MAKFESAADRVALGFTLNDLAATMRGMPRNARVLIRLRSGELVEIDHVTSAHVGNGNRPHASGAMPQGADYGIILVARDPERMESGQ